MAIDYQALFGGADYDPCTVLQALRPAYMKLIVEGAAVAEVTFRDRSVKYHKADITGLIALVRQLESECAAKNGVAGPRRAATAGYRRDWGI